MSEKHIKISHPGELLMREFMKPLQITQYKLAKEIDVPQIRISEIVRGKRAITPDTALRLSKYFSMSENFFINLQVDYDMRIIKRDLLKKIEQTITPYPRHDIDDMTTLH